MIGQREALRMFGCGVFDPQGRRLGIVGQLFLHDRTEQPEWITVQTGLFGTNESFVPLAGAAFDGVTLTVAVFKNIVRVAPRIRLDQGNLSPEQEHVLFHYYGISSGRTHVDTAESPADQYAQKYPNELPHWVTAT